MMNASLYGSIIRPSPSIHERYVPCILPPNPNRFRKDSKCISSRLTISVLPQELGLVSSDDVSLQNPVIKTTEVQVEEEAQAQADPGIVGGVLDAKSEEDRGSVLSTRVKKKKDEQDNYDNRFKLRNGREVGFCYTFFLQFYCGRLWASDGDFIDRGMLENFT